MPAKAARKASATSTKPIAPAKPRNALQKPLTPSPELAAIVGAEPAIQNRGVSKLWAYIGHRTPEPRGPP